MGPDLKGAGEEVAVMLVGSWFHSMSSRCERQRKQGWAGSFVGAARGTMTAAVRTSAE